MDVLLGVRIEVEPFRVDVDFVLRGGERGPLLSHACRLGTRFPA